ncbi:NmrA-like domain-containing protein [Mycena polygramma]|nr:NmrA-like domain-containing protein [Mycena polygramma]
MSSPRIVSIFAATGLQGAAVARTLPKDGTFTPRAITRNPNSDAALKLKAEGTEAVKADPLDRASLTDALRGSEAVFAVRDCDDFPGFSRGPGRARTGYQINMVDAAKEAGVKFFIFSSLPSLAKSTGGKHKNALHYEQKAEVEDYLRASVLHGVRRSALHVDRARRPPRDARAAQDFF